MEANKRYVTAGTHRKPGHPCKTSNRNVLNGALWIDRTGSQWSELPEKYEKKSTVHERFKSWKDSGILETIFAELSKESAPQNLSFDSTSCKVKVGGVAFRNREFGKTIV